MQYHDRNGNPLSRHTFTTSQYPELIEDYEEIFRWAGYRVADLDPYIHGWGRFSLRQADIDTDLAETKAAWPAPADSPGRAINEIWYETLTELWGKLEREKGAGRIGRDIVEGIEFFPIAILPFDGDTVWARYIPRSIAKEPEKQMAKAWMKLIDRNDKASKLPKSFKPQKDPPYAPGLFDALLAEVPAAFVRRISGTILPFPTNYHDNRLERLEGAAYGGQAGDVCYSLPVFPWGVPSYCLVGKAATLKGVPPLTIMAIFQADADRYERFMAQELTSGTWRGFLLKCQARVGHDYLRGLVGQARSGKSSTWKWKSWLETLPGSGLHESERREEETKRVDERHGTIIRQIEATCQEQVSEILKDVRFFESTSKGGCGHERITAKHKAVATQVLDAIRRVIPPRKQKEWAEAYLDKIAKCDAMDLPSTDENWAAQASEGLQAADFNFQQFKALFCRSRENTARDYRLSPLMVWAYLAGRIENTVRIAGEDWPRKFEDFKHVRPKCEIEDAWSTLEDLGNLLLSFESIRGVDVNGDTAGKRIVVEVRFEKPREFRKATGGSGLRPVLDALERIVKFKDTAAASGFIISFQDGKRPATHEWISD